LKINSSIPPLTSTGVKEGQKRAPAPAGAGATQQPQTAQDSVQLSSAAKLQSGSLEKAPAVDTAKVEAIKQAIAEGRFTINPEAIADGLIATARDLVLKGKD